jgi:diguanylate cyclase (GGDEF)-like protein
MPDSKSARAAKSAPSRGQQRTDGSTFRSEDEVEVGRRMEALKSSKIMMVDDEPTTIEVLATFLEGEGYENIVTSTDSREAVDLLRKHLPDCVLLDLMMPNVDGLQILREIRSDATLQHTPVIILTSSTDAETKLKALQHEATDFLGKPVDPSELALRLRNILAAKAYQDHLINYDGLTGLPNRRLFLDRVDRILRRASVESIPCSVLHLGLDRFKQINDALGHRAGDILLKAVARRLERSIRPSDLLAIPGLNEAGSPLCRLGGDEFLVILCGSPSADSTRTIARRIFSNLSQPFRISDDELIVTASIGISLFPEDAEDIEALLGHAATALSHAKQAGGNQIAFYSRALNTESSKRLLMENQLRKAIGREELLLYYQPKFDTYSGELRGAEALMRWNHPEQGLVPPVDFIPLAEETGLIESLGEWALATACHQNVAWQNAGFEPISISVNVSSKQMRRGNFVQTVRFALSDSGMAADHLILEVTESMLIEDQAKTLDMLNELKAMGVKISVDDFGTGYSSLSYLKSLPLDELKVDRSFVSGVSEGSDDSAIVNAIIAMSQSLGLIVVAEGVETAAQLRFLQNRGCDQYQGFLRGRPVPPSEWGDILKRSTGGD